jgi:hypothetical protein
MKKILLAGILLFIIVLSCNENENDFMSKGVITGIDFRECSCCGGYFIDINDSTYRFKSLPANSQMIIDHPVFPIFVKLDWAMEDTLCLGDEIKVFRIDLR